MRIAIAGDHGGFELKQEIVNLLKEELHVEVEDFGVYTTESVDYPEYAFKVGEKVVNGEFTHGILVCGTGVGISIAANKVKGVRCALVHDVFTARATREHNDSNVLAMGGRVIGIELAKEIVRTWLDTDFMGKHHQARLDRISKYEATSSP